MTSHPTDGLPDRLLRAATWLALLLTGLGLGISLAAGVVPSGIVFIAWAGIAAATVIGLSGLVSEGLSWIRAGGIQPTADTFPKHALQRPFPQQPDFSHCPNHVLLAAYAVARFRGRSAERSSLTNWCASDQVGGMALVTGAGGTGKTRLVSEVLATMTIKGWAAGFLRANAESTDLRDLDAIQEPLLIAVDYAETRGRQVVELLECVVGREPRKWRVVLIARASGDWCENLQTRTHDPRARSSIASSIHYSLGPVDVAVEDRREAFMEAASAFGSVLGLSSNVTPPDLASSPFDRPLYVQMAALNAICASSEARDGQLAMRPTEASLLQDALRRESAFWRETAESRHLTLDDPLLGQAVAVATLTTANNMNEAETALEALAGFAQDGGTLVRGQVARWLRDLAADDGLWFHPIEPDLLGEAHVADVLAATPKLASGVVRVLESDRAKHALTVLTRSARTRPHVVEALRWAVMDNLTSVWPQALEVAQESGEPMGSILATILGNEAVAADIPKLVAAQMPESTLSLREVAIAATRRALQDARECRDRKEIAKQANNLANRLFVVGRGLEGMPFILEAVSAYRDLASPGDDKSQLDLARVLGNAATMHWELDQHEEARALDREAADRFAQLMLSCPTQFLADRLLFLQNRIARLTYDGRQGQAIEASDEAVQTARDLVAQDGAATNRSRLAGTLVVRSACLGFMERREEALSAAREAAEVYRHLASEQRDVYGPAFANSLRAFATMLRANGRVDEAVGAAKESVLINRQLVQVNSGDDLRLELAAALVCLATAQEDAGRTEEALATLNEGRAIFDNVSHFSAQTSLWQKGVFLANYSRLLSLVGRRNDAMEVGTQTVSIYRSLVEAEPGAFTNGLASALYNLGKAASELGDRQGALTAMEESAELFRALSSSGAAGEPGPELPSVLNALSCLYKDLGLREAARDSAEEAVAEFRSLARKSPARFMSDLSQALYNLSNRLGDIGLKDAAFSAIEESAGIYRRLASERPELYLSDLAMALNAESNHLFGVGKAEQARSAIEESVQIYRPLADRFPEKFAPDLALALYTLSNCLASYGDTEASLRASEESIGLYRSASALSPEAFQEDLARTLGGHADKLASMDRGRAALGFATEASAIYRSLSTQYPDAMLPAFAFSLSRVSRLCFSLGEPSKGVRPGQECVSIYSLLADKNPSLYAEPLAFEVGRLAALMRLAGLGDEAARLTNGVVRTAGARHEGSAGDRPRRKKPTAK